MYKDLPDPKPVVRLPIHDVTTFVLVRPHYPENVGAAARALKTMGFTRLALVKPGRLALPTHEAAQKMAVKSRDVLSAASVFETLDEALDANAFLVTTTSRKGQSGAVSPRRLAPQLLELAAQGRPIVIALGNEKTGLAREDVDRGDAKLRIPMAAEQPSVNLAQTAQVIAYDLFCSALALREAVG